MIRIGQEGEGLGRMNGWNNECWVLGQELVRLGFYITPQDPTYRLQKVSPSTGSHQSSNYG